MTDTSNVVPLFRTLGSMAGSAPQFPQGLSVTHPVRELARDRIRLAREWHGRRAAWLAVSLARAALLMIRLIALAVLALPPVALLAYLTLHLLR